MSIKKDKVIKLKAGMRIVPAKGYEDWKKFTIVKVKGNRVEVERDDKSSHSFFVPSIVARLTYGYLKVERLVEQSHYLAEEDKLYNALLKENFILL